MSYFLALDQSTSASKATLFDAQGTAIDSVGREHRQHYPQAGWVEHDAEEIWRNVVDILRELARRRPAACAAAAGLAVTNQRETFVAFDRQSGVPLRPAIVWQCRRGDPICRQLAEEGAEELVVAKTGLKLDTYFSGSKMRRLLDDDPQLRRRVEAGEAVLGTIDAYLVHRLTGGATLACDATNASRTLLFDLDKLAWDDELCELFHVPRHALPEVRDSTARYGETDAGGALERAVPICGVIGDSQASLFGQRCFAVGSGKATFGSGTSLMFSVGSQRPAPSRGAVTALAWQIAGEPTFAVEGLINYSAATIAWLVNQLELLDDAAQCEEVARSVADNGGVYLVPAFAGLSAPYWNPDARGAIVGLSGHSNRGHVVRAAIESIGYQVRDVLDMIAHDCGVRPQTLQADGGPTRNELLMQFVADMAGVTLAAGEETASSSLGAALAGMLGLGIHADLAALAALPRAERRYSPAMPADEVERLVAGWNAAIRRVL